RVPDRGWRRPWAHLCHGRAGQGRAVDCGRADRRRAVRLAAEPVALGGAGRGLRAWRTGLSLDQSRRDLVCRGLRARLERARCRDGGEVDRMGKSTPRAEQVAEWEVRAETAYAAMYDAPDYDQKDLKDD